MKSNKGISLISLTIYLIVLTVLVGITANFTRYFFRNSKEAETSVEISQQYTKVIEYLVEEANSGIVDYIDIKDGENEESIYFYLNNETVHQYFWDGTTKRIYYLIYSNNLEKKQQYVLCGDVVLCDFIKDDVDESIFNINAQVGKSKYNNIFKLDL